MSRTARSARPVRHFSFANLAAATALVVAVGGGGAAVAAGLAKNSVGSPQIRDNAVTSADVRNNSVASADVRNNSLTGADVNEATLAAVRRAASAATVDSVRTLRVQAPAGQGAVVATVGSLVVELACTNNGGTFLSAAVSIRTTADHAVLAVGETVDGDLTVEDGARELARVTNGSQDAATTAFTAIDAGGRLVSGTGFAQVHAGGQQVCAAVLTVVG